jgi:hypothetical protein
MHGLHAFRTMIAATQLELAQIDEALTPQPFEVHYTQLVERCFALSLRAPPLEEVRGKRGHLTEELHKQLHDRHPELLEYARLGTLGAMFAFGDFVQGTKKDRLYVSKTIVEEIESIAGKHGVEAGVIRSWAKSVRRTRSPRDTVIALDKLVGKMQPMGDALIATPPELKTSLATFRRDHPKPRRVGFLIMKFGETQLHNSIAAAIQTCFGEHGMTVTRADRRAYSDDLYTNVKTYMYGCGFGIAVFEQLDCGEFNPNVSFEVGYMLAMGRPVCLLKDRALKTQQGDLLERLYLQFDVNDPVASLRPRLRKWLHDWHFLIPRRRMRSSLTPRTI